VLSSCVLCSGNKTVHFVYLCLVLSKIQEMCWWCEVLSISYVNQNLTLSELLMDSVQQLGVKVLLINTSWRHVSCLIAAMVSTVCLFKLLVINKHFKQFVWNMNRHGVSSILPIPLNSTWSKSPNLSIPIPFFTYSDQWLE